MKQSDIDTILRVAQSEADLRRELTDLRKRCEDLASAAAHEAEHYAEMFRPDIAEVFHSFWQSLADMAKGE